MNDKSSNDQKSKPPARKHGQDIDNTSKPLPVIVQNFSHDEGEEIVEGLEIIQGVEVVSEFDLVEEIKEQQKKELKEKITQELKQQFEEESEIISSIEVVELSEEDIVIEEESPDILSDTPDIKEKTLYEQKLELEEKINSEVESLKNLKIITDDSFDMEIDISHTKLNEKNRDRIEKKKKTSKNLKKQKTNKKKSKEVKAITVDDKKKSKELKAITVDDKKKSKELKAITVDDKKKSKELKAIKIDDKKKSKELKAIKIDDKKKSKELKAIKVDDKKKSKEIKIISSDVPKDKKNTPKKTKLIFQKGAVPKSPDLAEPHAIDRKLLNEKWNLLYEYDENFSEQILKKFVNNMWVTIHLARVNGGKNLDRLAPYISPDGRNFFNLRGKRSFDFSPSPINVKEILGLSITSIDFEQPKLIDNRIKIKTTIRGYYTESYSTISEVNSYFVEEIWELTRDMKVKSVSPDKVTSLNCPKCGNNPGIGDSTKRFSEYQCKSCGTYFIPGRHNWGIIPIVVSKESLFKKDALITEKPGIDIETPATTMNYELFWKLNDHISKEQFEHRIKLTFAALFSSRKSTDIKIMDRYVTNEFAELAKFWYNIRETHDLKQIVDSFSIESVTPVSISSDKFYDTIKILVKAKCHEFTVYQKNFIVAGSGKYQTQFKHFSEYWTFERPKLMPEPPLARCLNCGLELNPGVEMLKCPSCETIFESKEEDWFLSDITTK